MQTTEIQTVIFEDKKKKRSTGIALIYTFQKSQKNGGRSHFFFFFVSIRKQLKKKINVMNIKGNVHALW